LELLEESCPNLSSDEAGAKYQGKRDQPEKGDSGRTLHRRVLQGVFATDGISQRSPLAELGTAPTVEPDLSGVKRQRTPLCRAGSCRAE
jgi:hypothetical protein